MAGRGSAERGRFLFRDGRGSGGELPPNNWQSVFGGPAWTRIAEPDGSPGQWYFHAFDSSQPDFDWRNPEVAAYFDEVLRHWFDLGVDGFRIDVAHGMVKADGLPDWPGADDGTGGHNFAMWDQPEIHDIYRRWRAVGDRYDPPRYFVGEIWVPDPSSLVTYLAPDELHQTFAFDLLVQPWSAGHLREAIDRGLRDSARAGTVPAWTLSNHDVHRVVTRYGQEQVLDEPEPTDMIAAARRRGPVDLALGQRRARAALLLQLALPGTNYLYQGEELGLPEVFDLPDSARQDPIWLRSQGRELGRDGCRVPLPWRTTGPSLGFGPDAGAAPWLPQPDEFARYAVEAQGTGSTLALYRAALRTRRELFDADSPLRWVDTGQAGLLAFQRGRTVCVVNLSGHAVTIPRAWSAKVRLGSDDTVAADILPPDRAAWLVTDRDLAATETADGVLRDSPTLQPQPTAS
jgi:alpha-glucosidase